MAAILEQAEILGAFMLNKFIVGHNSNTILRKSRFHDEKGNFVGLEKCLTHAPLALSSGILRLLFDYRPKLPWIAYDTVSILEKFLTKDSRILEFGSGMSTVWYAKHAGEVFSVEDYFPWYEKVRVILENEQINNVHYCFTKSPQDYKNFMVNDEFGFDLIMVDGSYRSACVLNTAKLLKPGGILYLDNSDKHSSNLGGDTRLAEEYMLAFAKENKASVNYITDFAPTQFFVNQGLMIKKPLC